MFDFKDVIENDHGMSVKTSLYFRIVIDLYILFPTHSNPENIWKLWLFLSHMGDRCDGNV